MKSECLMGTEFQFCKMKSSGDWCPGYMTVFKTTEPYT